MNTTKIKNEGYKIIAWGTKLNFCPIMFLSLIFTFSQLSELNISCMQINNVTFENQLLSAWDPWVDWLLVQREPRQLHL